MTFSVKQFDQPIEHINGCEVFIFESATHLTCRLYKLAIDAEQLQLYRHVSFKGRLAGHPVESSAPTRIQDMSLGASDIWTFCTSTWCARRVLTPSFGNRDGSEWAESKLNPRLSSVFHFWQLISGISFHRLHDSHTPLGSAIRGQ